MVRIERALERSAPPGVEIVRSKDAAELVVLYAIDDVEAECARLTARGQRYAIMQCCVKTAAKRPNVLDWLEIWYPAVVVWSYYDLAAMVNNHKLADAYEKRVFQERGYFYHAPLGVDDVFKSPFDASAQRRKLVVTTGFVSAPNAEAVEEVHAAAALAGFEAVHVGPPEVPGVPAGRSLGWLPDAQLAALYRQAAFVASLRHVEGFELPAAEAAACGAVPIVFDQPATSHWYADLALFVPECSGDQLVRHLGIIFEDCAHYCSTHGGAEAAAEARRRFDWAEICRGFWARVTKRAEVAA